MQCIPAALTWVLVSPLRRTEWIRYTGGLYKLGTGQVVPLVVKVALPVLELACHSFGDTSTHQADQEQYTDAPTDHRENVVL